ncbi:MAG: amidohydrolase family protein [Rhodospirillales bacterium]|nr:amidohydrolase family protein [Rhodospirillales bacterium]
MNRIIIASQFILMAIMISPPSQAIDRTSVEVQLAQRGGGDRSSQRTPSKVIKKMDEDGDGRISRDEFLGPKNRFGKLDADGDGYVTKEELEARFSKTSKGPDFSKHPNAAWYAKLPVIVTHAHIKPDIGQGDRDWEGTTENAIRQMDEHGVQASIVMSPPSNRSENSYFDDLIRVTKKYPTRFRVLGGGRSLNPMINNISRDSVDEGDRADFIARADELIAKGAIGFGETTALHFSFRSGHPFENVQPDHPLYLLLADMAAKHDVPIDIHMEAVPEKWAVSKRMRKKSSDNPAYIEENITAFERLLRHNRKARIIWVHLGMDTTGLRSPDLTRRLLQAHPNLYLSLKLIRGLNARFPIFRGGARMDPDWKRLITKFPDRFMIGAEAWYLADNSVKGFRKGIAPAVRVVRLPYLPPVVARKVAFENAQRIFKFKLINPSDYPLPAGSAEPKTMGPLSKREIRKLIVGNTLDFIAPTNGNHLFIYFDEDGSAFLKRGGRNRVFTKRWFINKKSMLCRTTRNDKKHCTKILLKNQPDQITLFNKKFRYQAKLSNGRKLPE